MEEQMFTTLVTQFGKQTFKHKSLGIREPLLVHSPLVEHVASQGRSTNELVSLLDLAPTILEWYNLTYPQYTVRGKEVQLTGQSLLPYFNGENEKRHAIYGSHSLHEVTMYYPMRYVRTPRLPYHECCIIN